MRTRSIANAPSQADNRTTHKYTRPSTGAAYFIGISGATQAGKTTLGEQLTQRLGATGASVCLLHQDDYFNKKQNNRTKMWDEPESVEHDKLRTAVHGARKSAAFIILEGFQALHDETLLSNMDMCVMLNLDRATSRRRRLAAECQEDYFDDHVWPNHIRYISTLKARTGAWPKITLELEVTDMTHAKVLESVWDKLNPAIAASSEPKAEPTAALAQDNITHKRTRTSTRGYFEPIVNDHYYIKDKSNWYAPGRHTAGATWSIITPNLGKKGGTRQACYTLRDSKNGGLRVVATKSYDGGETINFLSGDKISQTQYEELLRINKGKHVAKIHGVKVDCKNSKMGMQYVEDTRGTRRAPNVEIRGDGAIVAINDIAEGDELLAKYGDLYWQLHDCIHAKQCSRTCECGARHSVCKKCGLRTWLEDCDC